ncbi:hypothetical protein AKG06_24250 [Pseudomonas aeruginosa]|nr:hypothetical protein AKG06_24250 [Pseudomonas aeruginosa]
MEQINAGLRTQKLQLFYQQLNGLLFGVENLLVIWGLPGHGRQLLRQPADRLPPVPRRGA